MPANGQIWTDNQSARLGRVLLEVLFGTTLDFEVGKTKAGF